MDGPASDSGTTGACAEGGLACVSLWQSWLGASVTVTRMAARGVWLPACPMRPGREPKGSPARPWPGFLLLLSTGRPGGDRSPIPRGPQQPGPGAAGPPGLWTQAWRGPEPHTQWLQGFQVRGLRCSGCPCWAPTEPWLRAAVLTPVPARWRGVGGHRGSPPPQPLRCLWPRGASSGGTCGRWLSGCCGHSPSLSACPRSPGFLTRSVGFGDIPPAGGGGGGGARAAERPLPSAPRVGITVTCALTGFQRVLWRRLCPSWTTRGAPLSCDAALGLDGAAWRQVLARLASLKPPPFLAEVCCVQDCLLAPGAVRGAAV